MNFFFKLSLKTKKKQKPMKKEISKRKKLLLICFAAFIGSSDACGVNITKLVFLSLIHLEKQTLLEPQKKKFVNKSAIAKSLDCHKKNNFTNLLGQQNIMSEPKSLTFCLTVWGE